MYVGCIQAWISKGEVAGKCVRIKLLRRLKAVKEVESAVE